MNNILLKHVDHGSVRLKELIFRLFIGASSLNHEQIP